MWLNKVGPYANPQETYSYYSLPFCRPAKEPQPSSKHSGIGQILEGNEFVNSGIDVQFGKDTPRTELCVASLDEAAAREFQDAVRRHYWYQMYLDDLPIWGMVGEVCARARARRSLPAAARPCARGAASPP